MAIIVQPVIREASLLGDPVPELLDPLQRLASHLARKQMGLSYFRQFPHSGQQVQCGRRERKMFGSLLLRVMGGLDPDATGEINLRPFRRQDLAEAHAASRDPVIQAGDNGAKSNQICPDPYMGVPINMMPQRYPNCRDGARNTPWSVSKPLK